MQSGIGEECDDGNQVSGDGCSNVCGTERLDIGYCGDGVVQAVLDEECDDGNQVNGDGCSNVCRIEEEGQVCGNGTLEGEEECDDGNTMSGDGCSTICELETEEGDGPRCGNGVLEAGEQCDGDIGDRKCSDFFGYRGGTLRCNDKCKYDLSECRSVDEVGVGLLPLTGTVKTIIVIILVMLSIALLTASLIFAFPSILVKEEKKPWGLVFDKDSRKPVAFAIVRLYQRAKLAMEKVTDLQGRYGFAIGNGKYKLEVSHDSYKKFIVKVGVRREIEGTVNRDIGLVAKKKGRFNLKSWLKEQQAMAREVFPKVSRYCYVIGFIFSITATALSPLIYNFAVIVFYVAVGIVYIIQGLKRGWGKVFDAKSKKGIGYAFVRLFDVKKNKLVDNQMSEKEGRYIFIVKEAGKYNLLASMKGYRFPSKKEDKKLVKTFCGSLVEAEVKKGEKTIGVDLGMDPISKEERDRLGLEGKKIGEEKFGSPFGSSGVVVKSK